MDVPDIVPGGENVVLGRMYGVRNAYILIEVLKNGS